MGMSLLKFSSANINPSGITESLLSTYVPGIVPVVLGRTAKYILVSQLLNMDFISSEDAY